MWKEHWEVRLRDICIPIAPCLHEIINNQVITYYIYATPCDCSDVVTHVATISLQLQPRMRSNAVREYA